MKVKIKFLTNLKKTILSALLILGVTSGAGLCAAASKSNTVKKVVALSKSVAEIDQQLYKKYGLDKKEIDFIESMIKLME